MLHRFVSSLVIISISGVGPASEVYQFDPSNKRSDIDAFEKDIYKILTSTIHVEFGRRRIVIEFMLTTGERWLKHQSRTLFGSYHEFPRLEEVTFQPAFLVPD